MVVRRAGERPALGLVQWGAIVVVAPGDAESPQDDGCSQRRVAQVPDGLAMVVVHPIGDQVDR